MIGQESLKNRFEECKSFDDLPRSIMLVGASGSGRRAFAHWLAIKVNITYVEIGGKIDDVRDMIDYCYKAENPTMYVIPNVDTMSAAAQNSMLKILEEPPKNAVFVVTTSQLDLVLSTIRSRCQVYLMGCYKQSEIVEFINQKYPDCSEETIKYLCSVCVFPGEISRMMKQDIPEFQKYVQLVFDNVAKVSGSNSFKIGDKINLGTDETKFDLELFWRAFVYTCIEHMAEDCKRYSDGVEVTMSSLIDLRIKGVNKQMSFDNWILAIRRVWM